MLIMLIPCLVPLTLVSFPRRGEAFAVWKCFRRKKQEKFIKIQSRRKVLIRKIRRKNIARHSWNCGIIQ